MCVGHLMIEGENTQWIITVPHLANVSVLMSTPMSSVLISCITRDIIHADTVQWLCNQPYPVDIVKGPYTIEHQRNDQVRRFLSRVECPTGSSRKYNPDFLFIVDNDVIPKPGTIETLLAVTEEQPDAIHVAPCMAVDRDNRPHPMAYQESDVTGNFIPATYGSTEKLEVAMTGMSGALIPRKVLLQIKRNWFHMQHDEDGNLIGTEDIWFWRMTAALGWKLYAHCYLTGDHIKWWRLASLG